MIYVLLGAAAFMFMEFVAWSNHKYIMHGFLWRWHKDHHTRDHMENLSLNEGSHMEKNDLFFLVYAIPAIVLFIVGLALSCLVCLSLAIGITSYGFIYFLIHDVVIHERPRISFLLHPKNKYLKAMIKAHKAHHWPKTKDDFHNYGLLIFPKRYFKD